MVISPFVFPSFSFSRRKEFCALMVAVAMGAALLQDHHINFW